MTPATAETEVTKPNGKHLDSTKPQTLIAKLAQACDAVGGVEKKGRNQAQGYDYVRAADVAKAIRHELHSRGVMVIQDEESAEWSEFTTMKGHAMRECKLRVAFILSDGTESLTVHAFGVAMDSGDKAIYKAKTGALKYFLRGLGLIPDEADDPENAEPQQLKPREVLTPDFPPRPQRPEAKRPEPQVPVGSIAPFQKSAFLNACKKAGKTDKQVTEYLGSLGCEALDEMPKKDFPEALKWAMEG